jgi:hypothetical protein
MRVSYAESQLSTSSFGTRGHVSSEAVVYFPDTLGRAADVNVPASASSPAVVQPNSESSAPVLAIDMQTMEVESMPPLSWGKC